MAETNDAEGAAKRSSEPPSGVQAIHTALRQPDNVLAKHLGYVQYATVTAAAGGTPVQPLRWHRCSELGPLAAGEPQPAPKGACTNSAVRITNDDGDDVL